MQRIQVGAVSLAGSVLWLTTALAAPPATYQYRDGDTHLGRLRHAGGTQNKRFADSGDVDATCDGVCHVVLCECTPASPGGESLRTCGGDIDGCKVVVVAIAVNTTRTLSGATQAACRQARRGTCR